MPRLLVLAASFLFLAFAVAAFPPESPPPAKKPVGRSVKDSLAEAHVAGNLKVELWAAEPLLENPVAISFDNQGRLYVAETTRLDAGVPDTRRHMYWMEDDIASKSVADRLAIYKKKYPGQPTYEGFEKHDDQIHLVWDSTGSGVADKSTVFAKGFNDPADGIAAGVLPYKDKVYFACIPSVYLLRDTKGTGVADEKSVLSTGYGVRNQYTGHDLHGLRIGPDGRLYFSIGDRALNVVTKEGTTIANTESGAVLRCELDGSHLELVHSGLRNPQKLAFDDAGNLFTYDNNSDSGDMARWVYITQGGESGWRCGYQYGTDYNPPWVKQGNRGPFNAERVWYVPGPGGSPPAYVTPPIAHFGNGPSGITHYPGLGLADKYKDHFFATDFTGSTGGSVIWSLAAKAKGASFEVVDLHKFVTGMLPTDCEFGPDGAFYYSDWVTGWTQTGTGRIFKVSDVGALKNPAVAEAQKLLAEGFEKRPADELVKLLASPHQLVRQSAQFELADRKATDKLAEVAIASSDKLARYHAIWGLGMIARRNPDVLGVLLKTSKIRDGEVRAQSVKMLGDVGKLPAATYEGALTTLLADPEPRVRYFAALAYGHLDTAPLEPLFDLLRTNNDVDAYLRQAAIVGLTNLVTPEKLPDIASKLHRDDSAAVRLGVVLTCRRQKSPAIALYLDDANPTIVEEAARAINDERIEAAYPALAKLADRPATDPVAYRALDAAFKIGTEGAGEPRCGVRGQDDQRRSRPCVRGSSCSATGRSRIAAITSRASPSTCRSAMPRSASMRSGPTWPACSSAAISSSTRRRRWRRSSPSRTSVRSWPPSSATRPGPSTRASRRWPRPAPSAGPGSTSSSAWASRRRSRSCASRPGRRRRGAMLPASSNRCRRCSTTPRRRSSRSRERSRSWPASRSRSRPTASSSTGSIACRPARRRRSSFSTSSTPPTAG